MPITTKMYADERQEEMKGYKHTKSFLQFLRDLIGVGLYRYTKMHAEIIASVQKSVYETQTETTKKQAEGKEA